MKVLKYICTVVGVYINKMKTTFIWKFWFLKSSFQITSLQVKRINPVNCQLFCFYVNAVRKLGRNQKLRYKVVFIVLIYCIDVLTMTVRNLKYYQRNNQNFFRRNLAWSINLRLIQTYVLLFVFSVSRSCGYTLQG